MEVASVFTSSVKFGDLTEESLELKLKTMLKWSKSDWQQSDLLNSKLHRTCNSLRYWSAKLKPAAIDRAIIITLFNENRDVKLDLTSLILAIEKFDVNIQVSGVSDFQNPRYLCFYFKDKKQRDFIQENFKTFEDSQVVYLSWALDESLVVFKVHWLPLAIDLELIQREVQKYASIINQERHFIKMMSAREIPTGKMVFKVKMKPDVSVDSVPHLALICGRDALITIRGRQPLCINCNVLGHIAKKCKMKFCVGCRGFVPRSHACVEAVGPSYAAITKGLHDLDPDLLQSDEEEEKVTEVGHSAFPGVEDLAAKITNLEAQIQAQNNLAGIATRLQKRRKTEDEESQALENEAEPPVSASQLGVSLLNPMAVDGSQLTDAKARSARDPLSFEGPSSLVNKVKKQSKITYGKTGNKKADLNKANKLFEDIFPQEEFVFKD